MIVRSENMQAFVDDLERRIEMHGKGQNCEDSRMNIMVTAVENPDYRMYPSKENIQYWKEFAQEQINYGRECVTEILEKAPELLNDEIVGPTVKAIMGGWEYGEKFVQWLDGLEVIE